MGQLELGIRDRAHGPSRRTVAWLALALVLGVAVVYAQVGHHEFVDYDTGKYLTQNPFVQRGLTRAGFVSAWTSFHAANWHPLTWLAHMLDVELFGMRPAGHHLHNAALHAANTVLVFALLLRWTRAAGPSALVAALFGLHPMHAESVAWVVERKDVLSTFFALLFLHAWTGWTRAPSLGRYALAWVLLACSLSAKSMGITLPCVLLLLDVWPLARGALPPRRRILEKLPFLPLIVASAWITSRAQEAGGALSSIERIELFPRVANAVWAVPNYVGKLFWPADLMAFHPWRDRTLATSDVLAVVLCAVVLVVISACAWSARRAAPFVGVGWLWFLGMLVPVLGLVQVGDQSMADRYAYLPSVGLFVAVVFGAEAALIRARVPAAARTVLALLVLFPSGYLGWKQVGTWKDTETLARHGLDIDPANYKMHGLLAWNLAQRAAAQDGSPAGRAAALRLQEIALAEYRAALAGVRTDPNDLDRMTDLLCRMGRFEEAEQLLRRASERAPEDPRLLARRAAIACVRGDWPAAEQLFRRASEASPSDPSFAIGLSFVLEQQGRLQAAEQVVRRVLRIRDQEARAWLRLGVQCRKQGRIEEGRASLARALELGLQGADAIEAAAELRSMETGR